MMGWCFVCKGFYSVRGEHSLEWAKRNMCPTHWEPREKVPHERVGWHPGMGVFMDTVYGNACGCERCKVTGAARRREIAAEREVNA